MKNRKKSEMSTLKEELKADLKQIRSKNARIFWIIFGVIILLFVFAIIFVGLNQNDPDKIKAIFGITGVSIIGLIVYMINIWKQKNYVDLVMVLVVTLNQDMLNSVVTVLLNKL